MKKTKLKPHFLPTEVTIKERESHNDLMGQTTEMIELNISLVSSGKTNGISNKKIVEFILKNLRR